MPAQATDAWRATQVALATKNDAEREKLWQATLKEIATLEQRERQVLLDVGIANSADPQGLHYRFIQDQGRLRRAQVVADSASRARVDSVRRTGDVSEILQAIRGRRIEAEAFAVRSDTNVLFWKEVDRDVRRAYDAYRGEDRPSNPADVKAAVGRAITHFERFGRLCREAMAFDAKRSATLRREVADLQQQADAFGKP